MGERKSMRIQGGAAGLGLVGEVAFVPEGALVVEECGALGVPVAGDFEGGGLGEVVFEARVSGGGSLGQEGCGERRGECGGDGESDDAMAHGAGPRGADAIGCDWWCAAARMTILMHLSGWVARDAVQALSGCDRLFTVKLHDKNRFS